MINSSKKKRKIIKIWNYFYFVSNNYFIIIFFFRYELKGFGEEPVAEDHIVINCKARETTTYEIELKNPYNDREISYKVETDVINSSGA
jgi:hypothetical protein